MQKTRRLLVGIFTFIGLLMLVLGITLYFVPRYATSIRGDIEVFPIVGGVFTAVGACQLLTAAIISAAMRASARRREALLGYGRRVSATVTAVQENLTVNMNGRHPWVVVAVCTHPMTGREVTIRSHSLWTCTVQPGQKVDVAFDPMNERKYAVDLHEPEESAWA